MNPNLHVTVGEQRAVCGMKESQSGAASNATEHAYLQGNIRTDCTVGVGACFKLVVARSVAQRTRTRTRFGVAVRRVAALVLWSASHHAFQKDGQGKHRRGFEYRVHTYRI